MHNCCCCCCMYAYKVSSRKMTVNSYCLSNAHFDDHFCYYRSCWLVWRIRFFEWNGRRAQRSRWSTRKATATIIVVSFVWSWLHTWTISMWVYYGMVSLSIISLILLFTYSMTTYSLFALSVHICWTLLSVFLNVVIARMWFRIAPNGCDYIVRSQIFI